MKGRLRRRCVRACGPSGRATRSTPQPSSNPTAPCTRSAADQPLRSLAMSRFDDDYDFDSPDESEDTDPLIRDLRAKIIRLEAQLDQLKASIREQTEESAIIAAQLAELQAEFVRLQARRRRDENLRVLAWVLAVASLAMTVWAYLTM